MRPRDVSHDPAVDPGRNVELDGVIDPFVPPVATSGCGVVDPGVVLPHGPTFRFVSSVHEHTPGESAAGIMRVRGDEPFIVDHFPGRPIVPGVLITEALAQLAGIAVAVCRHSDAMETPAAKIETRPALLARIDIRFSAVAVPPCEIALQAFVDRRLEALTLCRVRAMLREAEVASGEIVLRLPRAFDLRSDSGHEVDRA